MLKKFCANGAAFDADLALLSEVLLRCCAVDWRISTSADNFFLNSRAMSCEPLDASRLDNRERASVIQMCVCVHVLLN